MVDFSHGWVFVVSGFLSVVAVVSRFQSWVGFGCGLVDFSIGFAAMGNGFADRHGGMARWRSMWWVSILVRLVVVGF